ncbi:MAG: hypothetical protein RIQ81_1990 [Pseudomonadota bacterium]|jgi:hypothetical protein
MLRITGSFLAVLLVFGCAQLQKARKTDRDPTTGTRPIQTGPALPGPVTAQQPLPPLDSCVKPVEDNSRIKISPRDVIVAVDSSGSHRIALSAKAETRLAGGLNPDLKDKTLRFLVAGQIAGGATTNDNGVATLTVDVPLTPMTVTCYEAEHEGFRMPGRIFALPSNQSFFVSDIDEVISDLPEIRVPITSIPDSPVVPQAPETLRELSKSFVIVYLTARDDALANKTRSWLKYRDFPSGPLKIWNWTSTNGFGSSQEQQGAYKRAFLTELKKTFPRLVAGIGNRVHDATAYKDVGLLPIIINPKDSKASFPQGTVFVESWKDVLQVARP